MVVQNNTKTFTIDDLPNTIFVKGGSGNVAGANSSINLPVPTTTLNGMIITIRKYNNMGVVNINTIDFSSGYYNVSSNIVPNGSVTATNTLQMYSTISTIQFLIMDGLYYQII